MKKIVICMGSSCFSRGNNKNLKLLTDYIAEKNLETEIDVSGNLCEDNCSGGPNIKIDGVLYSKIDPICLVDLLEHFVQKKSTQE